MDKYACIEQAAQSGAFGCNPKPLPSDGQTKAGNYAKGRVRLHGLLLSIEQPRNSYRTGVSRDGKAWSSRMAAHYGGIVGVKGADGDLMDVFIGAWPESEMAWVINQNDPATQKFDEHKVMLAFESEEAARNAYLHSYERGWRGLGSMVACTLEQLRWWLRNGNHKLPLSAKSLPFDGNNDMEQTTAWDSNANPVGTDIAGIIYGIRRDDRDGLMLDSVTVADILEDADGEMTLDALVVPVAKLERKMAQLQAIMSASGESVSVAAMQVTPPFKQRGTTNVAAVFELSDGQTVTIYMHNPDTTPNKLAPGDELISWKWLLNKKDITIIVAPEKGEDLNPREVGRRIMRLAERNSARFADANKNRAARLASIEALKNDVAAKEGELASLEQEVQTLTAQVEEKRASAASASTDSPTDLPAGWTEASPGGIATNKDPESGGIVDKEIASGKWFAVANKEGIDTLQGFDTRADAFAALAAAIANPAETTGAIDIGPAVRGDVSSEEIFQAASREADKQAKALGAESIDPTSPEGYAKVMQHEPLQLWFQDRLDSFFGSRIIDVRNALRERGWEGENYARLLKKGEAGFEARTKNVGAGANVVGVTYTVYAVGPVPFELTDDLTKTAEEIAAAIDAAVPVQNAPDDSALVNAAVEAAKQGAGGITRIATSQFFTFSYEGEDVVLSDDLRAKVEAQIGEKLVEKVFPGLELEVALVPESSAQAAPQSDGDREFIQSAIDGKADFYDKAVTDRLAELAKQYPDGEMADLMKQAKTAAKNFFMAEFQKKAG